MSREKPSLIGGLDPLALFSLGGGDAGFAEWEPPDAGHAARLFPQWEIRSLLGRGGMGAVYLARQPELDRLVAVKILPIEACTDEAAVERFRREARTLAKLRHPGIVMLHESGVTPEGHVFFVMEYVDGMPLSEWLAAGKLDVPKAVDVVRQVCDALAYAHGCGVIHRDIKPSNILIDRSGQVKLADFGLARWDGGTTEPGMELSRTGMFVGTPAYTAPEQARDATRVDHRADLYSLGVLLYEMLTGEVPRGVFQKPSSKVGSDERLDEVVRRALQERPEDRYQQASQIQQDVAAVEAHPTRRPKTRGLAVGLGVSILALSALAAWLIRQWPESPDTPTETPPAAIAATSTPGTIELPDPVPPAPSLPPAPSTLETLPPAPEPPAQSGVKVWSLATLNPAVRPPAALTRVDWRDAVLLADGGVVIRTDGSLAIWRASDPGKVIELASTETWTALTSSPTAVLALAESGTLYQVDATARTLETVTSGITRIHPSARAGQILCSGPSGQLQVFNPADPANRQTLPTATGIRDAVLVADGRVWIVDAKGGLLSWSPGDGPAWKAENIGGLSRLHPTGEGLLSLAGNGTAAGHGGAAVPEGLAQVKRIATSPRAALALTTEGLGVAWGDAVEDGLQRFRMGGETRECRISPAGLVVSW